MVEQESRSQYLFRESSVESILAVFMHRDQVRQAVAVTATRAATMATEDITYRGDWEWWGRQ